jgi:uncharacterized protein
VTAKVLDSYALLAFFGDEPGADFVRSLLLKAEERDLELFMSVVNLGEVWYAIARTATPKTADQYIHEIQGMAISIVDADWGLTRKAAEYKAMGNIAYGDCFAAALAKNNKAELVTGNKEFESLEGEIKIAWI